MTEYRRNERFKLRLQRCEKLIGLLVWMPSPSIVEMIGYAGFDFVIIDMEHGPTGIETLEHMIRAAEAAGIVALVRVPDISGTAIQYALDAGAGGIVAPHVIDAEVAQELVDRAYYPPLGKRGVSTMSRSSRHGLSPASEYLASAAKRTSVLAMIEDIEALPHVPAIAGVRGIDGLFVGPSDLAASMGHTGAPDHRNVIDALSTIWRDGRRNRIPMATVARMPQDVAPLLQAGPSMIVFGASPLLGAALRDLRTATASIQSTDVRAD